ncbi:MerR family DNA-binding transcriptional regulator [Pontibacillus yanchengensis]|uniref:MerR family DNA-binding transcriptional regulator n=1 Tax=Pontibacillus yanchengensis TaxID=462910 RepID=UPI001F00A973|nr:MerR family DNA-binding transcriptional regulator [Pontibacillus yanchengensis]
MYKVKEVTNLVGVSVRTLHHYDEIELLQPESITPAGYRLYTNQNLKRLQRYLSKKWVSRYSKYSNPYRLWNMARKWRKQKCLKDLK